MDVDEETPSWLPKELFKAASEAVKAAVEDKSKPAKTIPVAIPPELAKKIINKMPKTAQTDDEDKDAQKRLSLSGEWLNRLLNGEKRVKNITLTLTKASEKRPFGVNGENNISKASSSSSSKRSFGDIFEAFVEKENAENVNKRGRKRKRNELQEPQVAIKSET